MFTTLSGFAAFYIPLASLLVLLVLFEKPLIELEEKHKRKHK